MGGRASFLMPGLPMSFEGVSDEVIFKLIQNLDAKDLLALNEAKGVQHQIAAQNAGDHRSIDGLGRVRMNISPVSFHYWGRRLGYQCWKDKQFLAEFERDNPEVRVKCGGTKASFGYMPSGEPRFRKSYA